MLNLVSIREATLNDIEKICSIEEKSFNKEDMYSKDLFRFYLTIAPKTFLVVELYNEVVGYVIAVIRRNYIGHIVSIAIDPNFRGKKLGRMLMEEIERKLRAMGCTVLRLEVDENNIIAHNLYLSLGYRDAYKIPCYYYGGRPAIVMFKLKQENHRKSV
ncbi:MAG: GNAT family N-acetyltransferase [Candidatus Methanomethylicia archaeon]|nr:GNAT family N-acetyltransferase [Candidatus Methanomethylicia archaeon]MCX8169123.1 GNAT family N-acetyltransferase [Candidatus Methanomethylicia archaeon]MDW7988855.1 N-acetyltransferase [Nitrososphaerota archaeon]